MDTLKINTNLTKEYWAELLSKTLSERGGSTRRYIYYDHKAKNLLLKRPEPALKKQGLKRLRLEDIITISEEVLKKESSREDERIYQSLKQMTSISKRKIQNQIFVIRLYVVWKQCIQHFLQKKAFLTTADIAENFYKRKFERKPSSPTQKESQGPQDGLKTNFSKNVSPTSPRQPEGHKSSSKSPSNLSPRNYTTKTDYDETSPIRILPNELMVHIFSELPTKYIFNILPLVSKKWQALSKDPYLHKLKEKKRGPSSLSKRLQ